MGEIACGFDFLSFYIDDESIYPSRKARTDFLVDLRDTIKNAKKDIYAVKNEPRRAEPRFIQSLNLLDKKIRGWGDAFSATTKRLLFAQVDAQIDEMYEEYLRWFGRVRRGRSMTHRRRLLGVALLIDSKDDRKTDIAVQSTRLYADRAPVFGHL
jgi:hypothetical protein